MEHDSRAIANQLIRRAHEAGGNITPMQAIKLVYYCHAWMLGLYHQPLLTKPIEACPYGPIPPEVYHCLRRYGGHPIRRPIDLYNEGVNEHPYGHKETNILNQVSDKYGACSGVRLSAMVHASGIPWHQIWTRNQRNSVIPDPVIEDYYAAQLERAERNKRP